MLTTLLAYLAPALGAYGIKKIHDKRQKKKIQEMIREAQNKFELGNVDYNGDDKNEDEDRDEYEDEDEDEYENEGKRYTREESDLLDEIDSLGLGQFLHQLKTQKQKTKGGMVWVDPSLPPEEQESRRRTNERLRYYNRLRREKRIREMQHREKVNKEAGEKIRRVRTEQKKLQKLLKKHPVNFEEISVDLDL